MTQCLCIHDKNQNIAWKSLLVHLLNLPFIFMFFKWQYWNCNNLKKRVRGKMYFTITSEVTQHEKKEEEVICNMNEDAKRPLCLYCIPAVYFPQNVLISAVKCPIATTQSVGPQNCKTPEAVDWEWRLSVPKCVFHLKFKLIGKSLRQRQVNVKVSWSQSWIVYTYLCMYTNKSCALIKTILWTEMGKIKTFVLIHK